MSESAPKTPQTRAPLVAEEARVESVNLEERRQYLLDHIQAYLDAGIPLSRLAELLGAEEDLETISSRTRGERAASGVTRFNIQRYVEEKSRLAEPIRLPEYIRPATGVIIPPDAGELVQAGSGKGIEKKGYIPRSKALVALLSELGIPYGVQDGQNTENMMRERSYIPYYLLHKETKEVEKLVLVNNEEGNATFVVCEIPEGTDPNEYLEMTKDELKERHEVTSVRYSGNLVDWKNTIEELLTAATSESPVVEPVHKIQTQDSERSPLEPAKTGWLTCRALAKALEKSGTWVSDRLDQITVAHPEWVRDAVDGIGRVRAHYSPEVFIALERQATELMTAKEGWNTLFGLSRLLGGENERRNWIAPRLAQILVEHPEWAEEALDSVDRKATHYSPEVLAELQKQAAQIGEAREDWLTIPELATATGRSRHWVASNVEGLQKIHPTWTEKARHKQGHIFKYYSPEMAELLKSKAQSLLEAPKEWMTANDLVATLTKSREWLVPRLQRLLSLNENWAQKFDRNGHSIVHYAPEILAALRQMKQDGK